MQRENKVKKAMLWLNQFKTFKDLIGAIPYEVLEKGAMLVLMYLSIIPFMAPIDGVLSGNNLYYYYFWFSNNELAGLYGWIIGIITYYKWYQEHKNNIRFSELIRQNMLGVALLCMLLWSVISCCLSDNFLISFIGTKYQKDGLLAYFGYAGVFIAAICIHDRKKMRMVMEVMVAVATLVTLITFLDIQAINFYMNIDTQRCFFQNSNHYGYYNCMMMLSAVALFVSDDCNKSRKEVCMKTLYRIIQIVLISNALNVCNALGSLLGVIGGLLGFLVLIKWVDKRKRIRLLFSILLILAVVVFLNSGAWNFNSEFQTLFSDVNMILTNAESAGLAGSRRWELWVGAIKMIVKKPLFGFGPDNLGVEYLRYGLPHSRPHNELLQFAASLGIPALLFYLIALSSHLKKFIQKFKHIDVEVLGIFCAVGAYLISSLFGLTMFYTSPFFFLILGLSFSFLRDISKTE